MAGDLKVLFLHGFPGLKTRQNRDLDEAVKAGLGLQTLRPLGRGLGVEPGTFRFTEEIDRREADCRGHADQSLVLVGHSWGGYQALHLASRCPEKLRGVILMSPLMGIPKDLQPILTQIHAEHPEVNWGSDRELISDGEALGAQQPFEKTLEKIPGDLRITILQAKEDPITPDDLLIAKLGHFKRAPWVRFLETDHQFLVNRPAVTRVLIDKVRELAGSLNEG